MKENKNQSKVKQTKNIMGKINTLRAGYLKIQTNGKPLAKLIRKKRKEREKELKDTKLDMKLEVNS